MNILRDKKIWMRNASGMNDFMEVTHGFNCLNAAYKGETGKEFNALLDAVFPGFSDRLKNLFNGWLNDLKFNTYLLCVSEHEDNEDINGRLSMWRGYGSASSVAFVLNTKVFFGEADDFGAFSSPVAYCDDAKFESEFRKIVENVKKDASFLKTLNQDIVLGIIFQMLRIASVCTKHPGFHEEQEWRVIYSPNLFNSKYIERAHASLNGTPQTIYKIPLKDVPEIKLDGAEISKLIDRIIIGPTQYPMVMWEAFVGLLKGADVENAEGKVFVSNIPLRR